MDQSSSFIESWKSIAQTTAFVLTILSSVYYLIYLIISSMINSRSKMHKYVLKNETNAMWISALGYVIAIALIFNAFLMAERDVTHMLVFSIKVALPIGLAITLGFGVRVYLNTYYPFILEKRLADIRFRERKNPKSGRPMRLLNEEEEDEYLTFEMIRQEEELKYDFDVWIEDTTGDTIIETYTGSTNKICGQCRFRTLKLVNEDIDEYTKFKTEHYSCSHCGHKERHTEVK